MEKKPSLLTFFRQISLIHSLTITSECLHVYFHRLRLSGDYTLNFTCCTHVACTHTDT